MKSLGKPFVDVIALLIIASLPMACAAPLQPPPHVTADSTMQVTKSNWEPERVELSPAQRRVVADVLGTKPTWYRKVNTHGYSAALDPEGRLHLIIDGEWYRVYPNWLSLEISKVDERQGTWSWNDARMQPVYEEFNRSFQRRGESSHVGPATTPSPRR